VILRLRVFRAALSPRDAGFASSRHGRSAPRRGARRGAAADRSTTYTGAADPNRSRTVAHRANGPHRSVGGNGLHRIPLPTAVVKRLRSRAARHRRTPTVDRPFGTVLLRSASSVLPTTGPVRLARVLTAADGDPANRRFRSVRCRRTATPAFSPARRATCRSRRGRPAPGSPARARRRRSEPRSADTPRRSPGVRCRSRRPRGP